MAIGASAIGAWWGARARWVSRRPRGSSNSGAGETNETAHAIGWWAGLLVGLVLQLVSGDTTMNELRR